MCENLGIWANLSQARNCDLSEHDFWVSLLSFDLIMYQRFENWLEVEPQFGITICGSLVSIKGVQSFLVTSYNL